MSSSIRQAGNLGESILGDDTLAVDEAMADLQKRDVTGRIWRKDHTVWKPGPAEIADRLDWLTVADTMRKQAPCLESFAREVRLDGFGHVVLLGMGGSSLGPEVLRQAFGDAEGHPRLIVLDSTVPDWVQAVTSAVDAARTLFLVSSKSGTTIEPVSLYAHFIALVEERVGRGRAGKNFVAITDPGTSLETLARERGYRRVFLNPEGIGGRYSVLSYFGLVPAVLAGIDITTVLDRGDRMREACGPGVSPDENPGAWLGAVMATLALRGRDKLTLVTSPSISGFGLWAEQLIAESTGKEDKGIVPVAGEPVMTPEHYGDDRLFVYLRLAGDDNATTDSAIERLMSAGQPVVRLALHDKYDLGAEFYRWEFATAVAGAVLRINPFDQPDVQQAKDLTAQALDEYGRSGSAPPLEATGSLQGLLSEARPGDYLAIMAYLHETPETDRALEELRRVVGERYRIATTLGYGPRYLHSTGQLHKGGPANGLFLRITARPKQEVAIPGEPYDFGVLSDAQALADFRALQRLGRRVAAVHVTRDAPKEIAALAG